jgi:cullin 1
VKCFKGHNVCQKALQGAFEHIVNKGTAQSTTAELIANFTDLLLKKGGVRMTEKQLETTLDNVVRLFSYLNDKDMFSEFYRKLLSKRLLLQRSSSADAEKSMIGKLKLRCGAQFTSKMEGMINDIRDEVRTCTITPTYKQYLLQSLPAFT